MSRRHVDARRCAFLMGAGRARGKAGGRKWVRPMPCDQLAHFVAGVELRCERHPGDGPLQFLHAPGTCRLCDRRRAPEVQP